MVTKRNCPICNKKTNINFIFENSMPKINGMDLSYNIGHCDCCGMIFAYQLPSLNVYKKYYESCSKYDNTAAIDKEVSDETSTDIEKLVNKSINILDIGCSIGLILNKLKNKGFTNIHGIDPNPKSKQIAKKTYDIDINTGFFNDSFNISTYDVIILSAVLEHISDLQSFLNPLRKSKRNSFLHISVPNAQYFSKLKNTEIFGEFSCEHINFFDKYSLVNLITQFGYVVVEIKERKYKNGQCDIVCIFQKTMQPTPFRKSKNSLNYINNYIIKCQKLLNENLKIFNEFDEIIIYGSGSHTLRFLSYIEKRIKIKFIVDDNKNLINKTIGKYKIFPSSKLIGETRTIFLSTKNSILRMIKNLRKQGINNKTINFYNTCHK